MIPRVGSKDQSLKDGPIRKGVSIYVGRAAEGLCLVAAVTDYIVRRG